MESLFYIREAKERGCRPFPLHLYPRARASRGSDNSTTRATRRNNLTIPITYFTITPPASLRSDRPDRIGTISDRFQTGTLIAFAGIRKQWYFCTPAEVEITLGPDD